MPDVPKDPLAVAEQKVALYRAAYDQLFARHQRLLREVRSALIEAGSLPQPPEVG